MEDPPVVYPKAWILLAQPIQHLFRARRWAWNESHSPFQVWKVLLLLELKLSPFQIELWHLLKQSKEATLHQKDLLCQP